MQLEGQGLKVADSCGTIVDTPIIESAARPNQYIEVGEDDLADAVDSADEEARWVKKGKDAFFGDRGYSAVDAEDGYAEHVEAHPANQAEVNKLAGIVDELIEPGIQPQGVLADKGYTSVTNREYLKSKGIGDLIRFKGSRGNPVHPLQKRMNVAFATLRDEVEQGFGTKKGRFHLHRARYFGVAKTQVQVAWATQGCQPAQGDWEAAERALASMCREWSALKAPREVLKVAQNELKPAEFFRILKFTAMAARSAVAGWVMQQS